MKILQPVAICTVILVTAAKAWDGGSGGKCKSVVLQGDYCVPVVALAEASAGWGAKDKNCGCLVLGQV